MKISTLIGTFIIPLLIGIYINGIAQLVNMSKMIENKMYYACPSDKQYNVTAPSYPHTYIDGKLQVKPGDHFTDENTGHDYLVDPKTGKATKLKERIEK